jgi:hypothetical protein
VRSDDDHRPAGLLSWRDFQFDAELEELPSSKTALTLEADTDPFCIADGAPRYQAWAEWFAELFRRHYPDAAPGTPIHLRRVHYRLVSQETPVPMVGSVDQGFAVSPIWIVPKSGQKKRGEVAGDTRPNVYANDVDSWDRLCTAAKYARHMGLIDGETIADNRAPEASREPDPRFIPEPNVFVDATEWEAIHEAAETGETDELLSPTLVLPDSPSLPRLSSNGVTTWRPICTHHLEIWVEKSTMTDVLRPICDRHGIVFQSLVGESSLTRTGDLLRRIRRNGNRPTRILYLSDFDPAGNSMPAAMSRRVEYLARSEDPDLDIQVTALALTLDQVKAYRLPTTWIKESEARRQQFMARFGVDGAVELDALEALQPGELGRLVIEAIGPYTSATERWKDELWDVANDLNQQLLAVDQGMDATLSDELALHEETFAEICLDTQKEYGLLRNRFIERVQGWAWSAAPAYEAAIEYLEENRPTADGVELPDPEVIYEPDPLLDTQRDYIEQLERYRRHKGLVS